MKPFPWRPRMAATSSLSPHLLTVIVVRDGMALCSFDCGVPGAEHVRSVWFRLDDLKPDEDDPATLGALLGVVREVWNAHLAQVTPWLRWDQLRRVNVVDGWRVCLNDATDRRCPPNERAESEFAALLAAYQEAP